MDIDEALTWAANRKNGILITIRQDGRAQSSDIVYAVDGGDVIISVTDDRAKTVNLRRDPRVVLHLTDPASWSYLSLDGTVALSDVTSSADDAANDALVEYYEAVNGSPHPNGDEYRQAMVDQGRLIARFTPTSAVGQVH
jgi:PPOX class probable F420-dependent enzyme